MAFLVPPPLKGHADAPVSCGTFWRAYAVDGLVVVQPFARYTDGRVTPAGVLSMPPEEWRDAFRPMLARAMAADPTVTLDDVTGVRS